MTPQEIFDTAFTKVYAQGERCMREGKCSYLNERGLRCAVGHLLNEAELDVLAEFGGGIGSMNYFEEQRIKEGRAPVLRKFFRDEELLLSDIQDAHDKAQGDFRHVFSQRMRCVATHHQLSIEVIDAAEAT